MKNAERKIGRHHFAFYKGWLQGLEIEALSSQYLEDGLDLRVAKSTLRWLQDALSQAALRQGRRGEARLLRISLRHVAVSMASADGPSPASSVPTLEEFKESEDPDDFYSEEELIRAYVEAFPVVVDHKAARRRRMVERQLEALHWIESLISTEPVRTDWVSAWFNKTIADRFVAGHIYTIGDLQARIEERGFRWWTTVPRLGVKGAARIIEWLRTYESTLGPVPAKALTPLRKLTRSELVPVRSNSQGIAPIESFSLPKELSLAVGKNRDVEGSQIEARNDREAIEAWIAASSGSPHTTRCYRKEGERLLMWAVLERQKLLSDLNVDDCVAYRNWLGELGRTDAQNWYYRIPQADWIGKRNTHRTDPAWRPFEGSLSLASVKQSLVILRSMFMWLVQTRYCVFNPWDVVNFKAAQQERLGSKLELTRVLSAEQWQFLVAHVAKKPDGLVKRRAVFLLLFAYSTALRVSELAAARKSHLYSMGLRGQLGSRWMLSVIGKGSKERPVPMNSDVIAALESYLEIRGLSMQSPADEDFPLLANLGAHSELSPSGVYTVLKGIFADAAQELRQLGHEQDASRMLDASTHWIRHSRGSHLASEGFPVALIQQLLGHASLATTSIYTRNHEETLYMALEQKGSGAT